jgi:hypothetical protein
VLLANAPRFLYHETSRRIMMEKIMATAVREKFSSQAAPEVLAALRQIGTEAPTHAQVAMVVHHATKKSPMGFSIYPVHSLYSIVFLG